MIGPSDFGELQREVAEIDSKFTAMADQIRYLEAAILALQSQLAQQERELGELRYQVSRGDQVPYPRTIGHVSKPIGDG